MTGVRTRYDVAPAALKQWAEDLLGAHVAEVQPRSGGMSPAIAVSLTGANGATAFVKAVSSDINPDTPTHFRHEIAVLSALPPAPYRAGLLSTYDDGHWVAIALEDIDGRHPDWTSKVDRERVYDAVMEQSRELTPIPPGLPGVSNRGGIVTYLETLHEPTDAELAGLPGWAAADLPHLVDLVELSLDHHRDEAFCHWDIRYDNILIRESDNQPILLDWGMARRGQRWGDAMVYGLEWVDSPDFDAIMARLALSPQEELDVTGFLAGIGGYLTMASTHAAPPSLPNLPAFRRQLGLACLQGVRRRTR